MIKVINGQVEGEALQPFTYVEKRRLSAPILKLTRWLRVSQCKRYMASGERHLDIGCGDGFLLRNSPYRECYGLEKRLGDKFEDIVGFQDDYFDVVTMLAVIEHISDPLPLLKEIRRVLKPNGLLILTTPKKVAELFIKLYVREIDEEHEIYYSYKSLKQLTEGLFEIHGHNTFIMGMNQVFCLKPVAPQEVSVPKPVSTFPKNEPQPEVEQAYKSQA